MFDRINSVNASIRRSIQINNIFKEKRCRLRCECITRWSSAFLVLESVKRAYDKGLIIHIDRYNQNNQTTENGFPISLEDIETYLQILMPAYQINLSFQSVNSSIGDVLPGEIFKNPSRKDIYLIEL